jgi:hypothetical protein
LTTLFKTRFPPTAPPPIRVQLLKKMDVDKIFLVFVTRTGSASGLEEGEYAGWRK